MESAISQFTYLPATKAERETFVQMCVDEITSGYRNPLELEIMLKNLQDTIKEIRDNQSVKESLRIEASKYPEKTFKFHNTEITKSSKTTYDYKACKDPEWNDLAKMITNREAYLKALKKKITVVDEDTGETTEVFPPSTKVTEFLTIKLNK